MKVLWFDSNLPYLLKDSSYPSGGAAVEVLAWISGFKENKINIGILSWEGSQNYLRGINTDFELIESYKLNKGLPLLKHFYYRLPQLYKSLQSYRPDFVIQECAGIITGLLAICSKLLKIPFVYRIGNDMEVDKRIKKRLSPLERILFYIGIYYASYINCQNTYQYAVIKKRYPEKHVFISYNPYKIRQIGNLSETREYIAWIGIFQKQKNLTALYDIVSHTPNIMYKIAGKPAESIDDNTKLAISNLKQCKNVEFVGFVPRDDILLFLSKAYALLNTSYYEGFSNTFLEAWISGTPVITTKNVNPDNIIEVNKLGYVANDYQNIIEFLKGRKFNDNYSTMCNNCIEYVTENHDPQKLANLFIKNLEILLNND
ncbi:glycosyltransferase family 4 protein [Calditrichota bacterium]